MSEPEERHGAHVFYMVIPGNIMVIPGNILVEVAYRPDA